MMTRVCPRAHPSLLAPPAGQRKDPALASQAAIANVLDESVDPLQFRPKHFAQSQVGVRMARPGLNFKQDCEHDDLCLSSLLLVQLLTRCASFCCPSSGREALACKVFRSEAAAIPARNRSSEAP